MTGDGDEANDGVVVDPVCGCPLLLEDDDNRSLEHDGRTWHFCSDGCRTRFLQVAARVHASEVAKLGALFTASERIRWGVA
ncbi:MAG TPA: YHS domain-containing protein [Anaeromyxobacteraceae bacterium]|nr:YHS domain-containing protein [Anaeromyxobacteraceae bacterium]